MATRDSSPPEKKLWSACEDGDTTTAQEALENGVDVNWENPQARNYTPLHRAILFGQEELVRLLLNNGANPNAMSKNKRTPLSSASLFGYKSIVILLLDNGANIETTVDDEILTPLHLAALRSHNEIVVLLIKRGANINPKSKDGNTPLHLASQRGNPAVIRSLYNHGANLFIQNKAGKTPLDLARREQHSTTCSYLEECMEKENGLHKEKVLWTACHDGDFDKAREAVASGADCDWANLDFNGYTSLHVATLFGHEAIVELLLKAGANPSQVSENEDMPLITAAREGHGGIVELLLDCPNVDIDTIDRRGSTALHKAAKHSHKEVLKILVEKGANVNLKNQKGNTPLHLSSKEGHPMGLHFLLQHNANPSIENKDNKTALNLAEDQNNSISVAILLDESNESILWKSSKEGDLTKVKECILKSVKVSWRSPACNDYTSLHIATIYGHDEVVKILLEKGADPNDSNRNGFSPLITAANNGDLVIFNHLLMWNANVNYQGIHRDSALHRAAKHSYQKMVEILVETQNAKLNLLNKDNNTPLHMAAMEGHAAVVRYLIGHGANIAVTNKQGKTACDLAWENAHHPVLEEFKKDQAQVKTYHDESDPETVDAAGSSSSSIDETLWNQAAKGNFQAVEESIKKKGNPTWKNRSYHGYTAILVAALYGHDKVVEVLLKLCGICARDTNDADETALHIAAREGDKSLVKRLLDNGVVPRNAKNLNGDTALHLATKYSHRAIVKLLVKRNVAFNLQNKDGNTPLHLAYREGHVVIVHRLLGNGAKTDILNHEGVTAEEMENQFVKRSHSVSKVVLQYTSSYHDQGGTVNEDRRKHSEELWSACQENDHVLVKRLLEAEANTGWTNPELKKYTCLHVAVMFGHTVVVNLLLNKGVYQDCTGNDQDHTPLHVAALEGRVEAAKLLVNKGAEKDPKDREQRTALHLAVMKGHWKIVEYLVCDCKVNIDEQDKDGNTALHIAVINDNAVLVENLIKSGAHIDMQNKKKEVPFDIAKKKCRKFLVKLLENADEYPMDTPARGYCIIINNNEFESHDNRPGSDQDVKELESLFENMLGFKVQTHRNLKAREMLLTMERVGLYEHRAPCLVVVVMSHGSAKGVWGTDSKPVAVTELTKYISDSKCPTLAGKPKIFLIQACRDSVIGDDVHISEPIAPDMDITLATIHGESAFRSSERGSFFVQTFIETMKEHAATKSYKEMITIVTHKLSKIQIPVQRTTLRKRLFLRPVRNIQIPLVIVDEPCEPGEEEERKDQMVVGGLCRKRAESK